MEINYRQLNPLGFHLLVLLRDVSIRNIIQYGGSSSGKTYSTAQIILLLTEWEGSNTLVLRKVGASISDSVFQDFVRAADQLGISGDFKFSEATKKIKCLRNNAYIRFKGLDDAEKIKGLSNFKRVVMDELSEYDEEDYNQISLRLRGIEGQQIIATFNPIKETHWIKRKLFDTQTWDEIPYDNVVIDGRRIRKELTKVKSMRINNPYEIMNPKTGKMETHASDTVVIQTTYLNNFWVVGSPDGKYGYYDEQCIARFEWFRKNNPDYYNVYALGEWGVIQTGSEFFGSFNRGRHTGRYPFDPELPVHLCVDNNVLPYITNLFYQIDYSDGKEIRQFDELCVGNPDNTVRRSARLVAERLHGYGVSKVFLHGDASAKAANTIDEKKRSFMDLYIETLRAEGIEVEDKVGNKNPSVVMSGEFINAIFDGLFPDLGIGIDEERCHKSIEDHMCVQKDENGGMLKTRIKDKLTGQTYEEHGHCSDCLRYVVCDLYRDEFIKFSNMRNRNLYAKSGALSVYHPDVECSYSADVMYAMPNVNGKFCMVYGKRCGERWHIVHSEMCETVSTSEIKERVKRWNPTVTIFECSDSYFPFIRELRKEMSGVRVMREGGDLDRRIAATSDYVRGNVLFNDTAMTEDAGYSAFIDNLLDYSKDGDCKEASAVLSGFSMFVAKSFSTAKTT